MPYLDLLLAVAAVAACLFAGYVAGRAHARTSIDGIAAATYATYVAEQIDDDRTALHSLPPGLEASAVWEHAARRGISIRDAAAELFVAQARARLDANLARHRHRPRTP